MSMATSVPAQRRTACRGGREGAVATGMAAAPSRRHQADPVVGHPAHLQRIGGLQHAQRAPQVQQRIGASVATGSASAPAATPAADGRCDANAVQAYVGKQASAAIVEEARRAAGAEVARALRPHDAVTMDYNPRRLNIDVDDTLVIKRLSCG